MTCGQRIEPVQCDFPWRESWKEPQWLTQLEARDPTEAAHPGQSPSVEGRVTRVQHVAHSSVLAGPLEYMFFYKAIVTKLYQQKSLL